MRSLGERKITIDCDVLEADGGTRTASITGGFVALALALARVTKPASSPRPVLREPVAAISVGQLEDDARARPRLHRRQRGAGRSQPRRHRQARRIIEVQGTAEGEAVPRRDLDALVDLASSASSSLTQIQAKVLAVGGVDLAALFLPREVRRMSHRTTLVIATTNRGKILELRALLADLPLDVGRRERGARRQNRRWSRTARPSRTTRTRRR